MLLLIYFVDTTSWTLIWAVADTIYDTIGALSLVESECVCLLVCKSIYVHVSACVPFCLCVCLSVCLPVWQFTCVSLSMSVWACQPATVSLYMLYIPLSGDRLSKYRSICVTLSRSTCLYACIPALLRTFVILLYVYLFYLFVFSYISTSLKQLASSRVFWMYNECYAVVRNRCQYNVQKNTIFL